MRPSVRAVAITVTVLSVAAAGVIVALAVRGGGEPVAAASTPGASVPTASPNPEVTASAVPVEPQPLPPVEGAIPVPAFPASDIPWLEVGPGWFVVVYDTDADDNSVESEVTAGFKETLLSGAVMLVSPSGDLYYVDRLDGRGRGEPIAWTADGLVIAEQHVSAVDKKSHAYMSTLSLTTGKRSTKVGVPFLPRLIRAYPDGSLLVTPGWGNLYLLDASFTVKHRFAMSDGRYASTGSCTVPSPSGATIACLVENGDGKTDVWKFNVASGKGSKIDVFRLNPDHYYLLHWWDEHSFAFTRYDADWTKSTTSTYNVSTKKVNDVTVRLGDGTPASLQDADIQGARIVAANNGVENGIEIDDYAGKPIATLPCLNEVVDSFGYVLSECYDGRATVFTTVDLASGESAVVARYAENPWTYFPYGAHIVMLPFSG